MTQTWAIILDAYRELNSKRLFWLTLVLSGVVVAAFALLTLHENGLRVIAWDVDLPGLNSNDLKPEVFYKSMYVALGIGFWLTWIASILALVSTAGIFPDLVTSGSIDLVVSKPISRMRIFLTKYVGGLLFVTLQVTVFSVASFLLIGFKGGSWAPAILLAIPIVAVFFSYLFSVCVLFGVLTRSTIASLLLTLLVWFVIFIVHASESGILSFDLMTDQQVEIRTRRVERLQRQIADLGEVAAENTSDIKARLEGELVTAQSELESANTTKSRVEMIHDIAYVVKTVLPKTAETTSLMERWLIDLAELEASTAASSETIEMNGDEIDQGRLQMDVAREIRSRSVWWVLGTSLAFEAAVLALACWVFCRRDY